MKRTEIVGYACPVCNTANPVSVKYCSQCGHWLLDTVLEPIPLNEKEFKKRMKDTSFNLWKSLASIQIVLAIFMLLSLYSGAWFRLWVVCYVAGVGSFNYLVGRSIAKQQTKIPE